MALSGCGTGSSASGGSSASAGSSGGGGSKTPTVAFVPKLQGVPYFEAMNAGGEQACQQLGCRWLYQSSVQADAAAQADIVRSCIQQHVNTGYLDQALPLVRHSARVFSPH